MKRRFFSIISAILTIAVILPARGSIAKAAPTQATPSITLPDKRNTSPATGTKQADTTHRPSIPDNPLPFGGDPSGGDPFGGDPFDGSGIVTIEQPETSSDIATLHHTQQGISTGHTEQYVNYKTWGGGNWTARINAAGQFIHTQQGASLDHTDTIINYISWDGQNWTATIDPVSKVFTHKRQGASSSHTDTILNYVGWDGSQWTMRLQ